MTGAVVLTAAVGVVCAAFSNASFSGYFWWSCSSSVGACVRSAVGGCSAPASHLYLCGGCCVAVGVGIPLAIVCCPCIVFFVFFNRGIAFSLSLLLLAPPHLMMTGVCEREQARATTCAIVAPAADLEACCV